MMKALGIGLMGFLVSFLVSFLAYAGQPWESSPEAIARGKDLYAAQCSACHGAAGKGDGPAAGALKPPPRDFTSTEGWKKGRKASQVFATLKEGIPGSAMGSFTSVPVADRWALVHYVVSLGSKPEADTPADLAKIGITPGKEAVAEAKVETVSVEVVMQQMGQPEGERVQVFHPGLPELGELARAASLGARIYRTHCVSCHGTRGEGGFKVRNLGVNPIVYVTTRPFSASAGVKSADQFSRTVARGIPGDLMPGTGQLSSLEMNELYQYVRGLSATR